MTNFKDIIQGVDKDTLCIKVSLDIYPLECIFKTCYWYTEKCYLYLDKKENDVFVFFKPKEGSKLDLNNLAEEYLNELINQRVRTDVSHETGKIRELLVAQAFAEGDLLQMKETKSEDDYVSDPLKISSLKGK